MKKTDSCICITINNQLLITIIYIKRFITSQNVIIVTDPYENVTQTIVMQNDQYIKMTVQLYSSYANALIINLIYLAGQLVIAATLNSIVFLLYILRLFFLV